MAAVNLTPNDVIAVFALHDIELSNPIPHRPATFIQGGPTAIGGPATNDKAMDEVAGVLAAFYPDELSAESNARGAADFAGRRGERLQVRNVLIWFDPALPAEWQRRIRAAIEVLRKSELQAQS